MKLAWWTVTVNAILTLSLLGCSRGPSLDPPRRIVLVTLDTLRADHLSAYGYPRKTTPFLDRLAEQSVVFSNAYSASSTTVAAHTSIFTSLYPAQHQLIRNGEELPPSVLTMAQVLERRDYRTAGFSPVGFLSTLSRGFDTFHARAGYRPAAEVLHDVRDWLDTLPGNEKIFLWIHLFDVHEWYVPKHRDPAFAGKAAAAGTGDSGALLRYLRERQGIETHADNPAQLFEEVDAYDDQILSVDRALETFFADWSRRGLRDHTLWILTADHGEGLGSHSLLGHGEHIYNEQIRVPLLIYDADKRFLPRRVEGLVSHVDLLPTLAELVGGSLDDQVFPANGRSLLPVLAGGAEPATDRFVVSQRRDADNQSRRGWIPGQVVSLESTRYKYIYRTEASDAFYSLSDDPTESRDLISQPSEVKDRMQHELSQRFASMQRQGKHLQRSGIAARHLEELEALGYL